jgi:hypothetical protein
MKLEELKTGQKIKLPVNKSMVEIKSKNESNFSKYVSGTVLYTPKDGDESYIQDWILIGFEENDKITGAWNVDENSGCGLKDKNKYKHFKFVRWIPPYYEVELIKEDNKSTLFPIVCLGALGIFAAGSSSKTLKNINKVRKN